MIGLETKSLDCTLWLNTFLNSIDSNHYVVVDLPPDHPYFFANENQDFISSWNDSLNFV